MVWGTLRQSYSCLLGIVINAIILLALGLVQIFPADPRSWFPPTWFVFMLLFIGLLMPIGLALAIRDYLKQQRLPALIGFLLCCWPVLFALKDWVARWLTIQLRSL